MNIFDYIIAEAENSKTSPKRLEEILEDSQYECIRFPLQCAILRNLNTSKEILDKLSHELSREIKYRVARHPKTSPETLNQLSRNYDNDIRKAVAAHPNTSRRTLTSMTFDPDWEVQWNVAFNKKTPIEILLKLSDNSRHWEVANTAKSFYNKRIKETSIGTKIVNWFRAII